MNAFEVSWRRIMTILKHYEQQIHSAPYALKVLETLRQQITRSITEGTLSSHLLLVILGWTTDSP
jgi:hypothetical protein